MTPAAARALGRQAPATSWTAADLADETWWSLDLRDIVGAEALALPAGGGLRRQVDVTLRRTTIGPASAPMARVAEAVTGYLRDGPGFVRLRGFPVDDVGRGRVVDLFAWLCRRFGRLLAQNVGGERVYLVKTTGVGDDRSYGSRGTGELLFHTDQAAAPAPALPRVLGMCLLDRAEQGGETRLASGHTVVNSLLDRDPSLAAALADRVWWGRPADGTSDAAPVRAPMARVRPDGRADLRLNRYFVELGQAQRGEPMAATTRALLEAIDDLLADPNNSVAMLLEPGDALVVDNAVVMHNRSAYVDGPGHERVLARLWAR